MELEVLPAAKGDCLLLHHEENGHKRLILIDGGPAGVYKQSLKPRLLELRKERIAEGAIGKSDPLVIDLIIVSHIDDDHINGIEALFDDIAAQGGTHKPDFRVDRLWHNSFLSLVDAKSGDVAALAGAGDAIIASLGAMAPEAAKEGAEDLEMVLASIAQGYNLLAQAKALGIAINPGFKGKTIEAHSAAPLVIDGLSIRLLGPRKSELDALRKDFAAWLKARNKGQATPASLLASFTDTSVANLSSIVLLVEKGKKRFLLTGDARGDKIMEAAAAFGLASKSQPLSVNIFKVPHHGSDRNNSAECFAMFPAEHYVFSGDGKHENPDRETFEYLAAARAGAKTIVELTYPPADIDKVRAQEWEKKHKPRLFDPATQGIAPYLSKQKNFVVRHPPPR